MSWTPEEDKIIVEFYEKSSKEEILSKLPSRNWRSIYRRSVILNLSRPKDDAWKTEDDELLKQIYSNTPKDLLLSKFPGRTWKAIKWHALNTLRLIRTREIYQEECRKTNLARRGVEYPTQSVDVRNKVKRAVQERYGVDNVFQAEEIKEKMKETNLEKYGVENPNQSEEIREKSRQTNQDLYGVDNPFQMVDRVKEGMKKKYGVESPLQDPTIRERVRKTNVERYGFPVPSQSLEVQKKFQDTSFKKFGTKTPFQNEEIKQRIIETNMARYGVDNPLKSKIIQNKARETLYKYGTQKCSKQQMYIAILLKGKVNYPVENCNVDILLENNLICEYDGGGHNLGVKLNVMSKEESISAERRRDKFLKSKGYSIIRIISGKDLLPEDHIILKMIDEAKEYLKTGHSWINFNIDENRVQSKEFQSEYDFGKIREIKEKDLCM